MKIITIADVEYLAFRLAKEHLSFDNNKWLKADNQELFNFTVWVAQSPSYFKEQVVSAIEKFIRDHLTDAD